MSRLADYIDVLREAANDIIPGDRYFEERSYLNTARKSDTGSVMGNLAFWQTCEGIERIFFIIADDLTAVLRAQRKPHPSNAVNLLKLA